jgi:DNA-binding response OmpR family regulator
MRILVIEDEHRIARAVQEGLEQESYAVDISYDGEDGYNAARSNDYDLIIMDVMMPKLDGFEVTKKLRQESIHTPILLLTAKSQTRDIVAGLDGGADDYLPKPFPFAVLLARVRALLRRPHDSTGDILHAGDLQLNTRTKIVERAGQPIRLSSREFALLEYMLRNQDRVLSKNNIITHVWDFDADILPNTVEVFIAYLRSKVDKPFDGPALIQTVRGFGYRINPAQDETA